MREKLAQRRATGLRKKPTDAEGKLWYFLRRKHLGARFRRQVPIGPFITDFACLESRVIIEVDGSQHSAAVDGARDEFLRQRGFRVLRFWDNDVLVRTDAVLEVILSRLKSPPSP